MAPWRAAGGIDHWSHSCWARLRRPGEQPAVLRAAGIIGLAEPRPRRTPGSRSSSCGFLFARPGRMKCPLGHPAHTISRRRRTWPRRQRACCPSSFQDPAAASRTAVSWLLGVPAVMFAVPSTGSIAPRSAITCSAVLMSASLPGAAPRRRGPGTGGVSSARFPSDPCPANLKSARGGCHEEDHSESSSAARDCQVLRQPEDHAAGGQEGLASELAPTPRQLHQTRQPDSLPASQAICCRRQSPSARTRSDPPWPSSTARV